MNLEKLVVVAGIPGVHRILATRNNGLIIQDTVEQRSRFVPMRANQFTALGTISVYTETEVDAIPLGEVWQKMYDNLSTFTPAPPNASSDELRNYFSSVFPEHDKERVHINDIKKCIKWFTFAHEKGMLQALVEATTDAPNNIEATVESSEN